LSKATKEAARGGDRLMAMRSAIGRVIKGHGKERGVEKTTNLGNSGIFV